MNKVRVNIVTEPPAIGKPEMMGGIRDKVEAANWAEKNGYSTVYLLLGRQRVYADKLTKKIEVLAEQIQTKSGRLLEMAETAQGLIEYIIILALVGLVTWLAGDLLGWPW